MPYDVPVYSFEALRKAAGAFLARYHPKGPVPVPIERILEFQMGIDIYPMPGLEETARTVGFTMSDLTTVCVDEWVYRNQPGRYRFTLAHEAAHLVLHADFYRALGLKSFRDIQGFLDSIGDEEYGWLEWQAYSFAGLVLVPKSELETHLAWCRDRVQATGSKLVQDKEFAADLVEACLAQVFDVSQGVIDRRLQRENWKPLL